MDLFEIGLITLNNRGQIIWRVKQFEEVSFLLNIFYSYPLITKKRFTVSLFNHIRYNYYNNRPLSNEQYQELVILKNKINDRGLNLDHSDKLKECNITINKYWLIGFLEGDGSFSFAHNRPIINLAQKGSNYTMLKIQEYLTDIISNEIPNWTSKVFLSTRKDGCVSVYITDIDALYKVIIPYFNNNLKARKIVDFKIWVISVNIYINGYHFIKEGREIINIISNCINEKRYSTNNTPEELNIINNNIIKINELYNSIINSIKPIFSVFKGINYTYSVIAIKYSKIYPNKNIQIYIYDTVLK